MSETEDSQADEDDRRRRLSGYVFAVGERPYCCWEWDLEDRNVRFIDGLDTSSYGTFADMCLDELRTDAKLSASIALRGAYHQAVETLFSLLGAYVQAPEAVPAWLSKCQTSDLEGVVHALREGLPILTQAGRHSIKLEDLSRYILRHCWTDEVGPDSTAARFARFWRRLAADLLDPNHRAEYNAIKHGLRVSPGGFNLSVGVQDEPTVAAPADRMRSMGGSFFGSTFLRSEKVGMTSHHMRVRSVSLNWSAEAMAQRLRLLSLSIANVVGSLRCELGAPPETVEFRRPERPVVFEDAWSWSPGIRISALDTVVRVEEEDECSKAELLADLESRGIASRS